MGRKAINAKREARSMPGVQAGDDKREALRQRLARAAYAAHQFAIDAARLLCDEKCEDIIALDLRGVSTICDYFVIGTGTSDRQMRAVADHLRELGKGRGEVPYSVSVTTRAWIVVDYVDVVVHLFDTEKRSYYDWNLSDCPWGGGVETSKIKTSKVETKRKRTNRL
jgi:ribosome-associated protein